MMMEPRQIAESQNEYEAGLVYDQPERTDSEVIHSISVDTWTADAAEYLTVHGLGQVSDLITMEGALYHERAGDSVAADKLYSDLGRDIVSRVIAYAREQEGKL